MLFSWTRRSLLAGMGLAVLPHGFRAGTASARSVAMPQGAVVLTFAGDIAHANRGPLGPRADGFLKYHDIDFDKAFVFDRAMLAEFPQHEIRAQPPQYDAPVTFRGPLLKDVLNSLGAAGAAIQTRALDGFAVDLSAADLAAKDWTLSLEADGRPFGIGDRGPVWLMHTPSALKVAEEEEQRWPWALFFIRVKK
jgi:hypothetical protein